MIFTLTLYLNGASHCGDSALANIRAICEALPVGSYQLKVVDVLADPEAADNARVIATPTLIRDLPPPQRRVIGDLSDTARVRSALGLEVS